MTNRDREMLEYLRTRIGFYVIDPNSGNPYWAKQALKHLRSAKTNLQKSLALMDKAKTDNPYPTLNK